MFDSVDLIATHSILSIFGSVLCVVLMQLSAKHGDLAHLDPLEVFAWRALFLITGICLAWSSSYSGYMSLPPFPPHVMLIATLDIGMVLRAAQILSRCRRLRGA